MKKMNTILCVTKCVSQCVCERERGKSKRREKVEGDYPIATVLAFAFVQLIALLTTIGLISAVDTVLVVVTHEVLVDTTILASKLGGTVAGDLCKSNRHHSVIVILPIQDCTYMYSLYLST